MTRRYRAVVLDLFGTVVHFRTAPDPTVAWLAAPFAAACPGAPFAAFRDALRAVSRALQAERGAEQREVPSRERFRRALAQLGVADLVAAEALSRAHMAHLADQTWLPPGHGEVLAALAAEYRLGLVSNFDHAETAHAILARHGIAHHFAVALVSESFGRRKPHPAIFAAALAQLGVAPHEALFVGDSHADDVVGAHAAGLDVVWLQADAAPAPGPAPTYRLVDLRALPALLAQA